MTDKENLAVFTPLERNLLALFANQIGTALTNASLYERATIDPLTQIFCRGYFFQRLQEEIYHARENGLPLSLCMVDVDYFKNINDRHTHQGGDRVLRQIGELLKRIGGSEASVGRYGGEEFAVLFRLNREESMKKAEDIREKVSQYAFEILDGQKISVTCSIGVSHLKPGDVSTPLIERADKALYVAKRKGRNCVVSEEESGKYKPLSLKEKELQLI